MLFSSDNSKYIDGLQFVPVTFPYNVPDALLVENLHVRQLIEYCNNKQIKKAFVQGFSDYSFLGACKCLEHIAIELRLPFDAHAAQKSGTILYDLRCMQTLPNLRSIDIRVNERPGYRVKVQLDLSAIETLEQFCGAYQLVDGIENSVHLKTLRVRGVRAQNLDIFKKLTSLDTAYISFSSMESLAGLENFQRLQCLYLINNRRLQDINALCCVKDSLHALRIENCSQIQDFSVLSELNELELLELSGQNSLPSLAFIRNMPNLKTLIFSMNVLDGDLSPCRNLLWAYSERNSKHYNLRDDDLPKSIFCRGNENIALWRRLE